MPTSLIELCESGKNLPRPNFAEVHYDPKGYLESLERENHHFWYRVRREVILRLMNRWCLKGSRSVEIGCGTGVNVTLLCESGFPTIGVDAYESFGIEKGKATTPRFVQGDIMPIEPKAEFDCVLLLDVIEHIEDDTKFLQQAFKFLKPGGRMVISVPSFQALWSEVDVYSGHFRRYTKKSLREAVAKANQDTEILQQFYFYGFFTPLMLLSRKASKKGHATIKKEASLSSLLNALFGLVARIEKLFLPVGGLPVGTSLFTVIQKK